MCQRKTWRTLALALMVSAGFLFGARSTNTARANDAPPIDENVELENAKKLFRGGEFDQSITILERLISTSTLAQIQRIQALEYLAFCNVAKDNYDRVQTCFADILPIRPDYEPPESFRSHPGLMESYMKARKKIVGDVKVSAVSGDIKTVAVLDFDNNSIDDAERLANLGKGLADILITDLGMLKKLKVVERERLQFILQEIALGDTTGGGKQPIDPEYAVRLGKLMGAQSVLIGSFMKIDKKLRLDTRLVKTETSEILKTDFVMGKQDAVLELASKLALKVAQNLDVAINQAERKNLERLQNKEVPLEAWMVYAEALNRLDRERYTDARKLLEKALAIAPAFEAANQKMSVLKAFGK
jgi:TolB-like protein